MRAHIFGRRWLLGFALALVYIPLRTYINIPPEGRHIIPGKLPLFGVEILISTVFYTSWIYLVDWILDKLAPLTGGDNPLEFQLSNQLITFIPAILLAVLFNFLLIYTWGKMDLLWTKMPRPFLREPNWLLIRPIRARANEALTTLALIAAYYLCVNNRVQEQLKKLLVNAEKLEKETSNARFLALKNQISPHFLFNNLSVLSSLVESRPEQSGEFIQRLSQTYRYILEQAELHQTSLQEEVRFLETYTYLLSKRFKDKIIMDVRLSESDLQRYAIIPLTLQLLIENAVKHNTMSVANPLTISIWIEQEMLIVSNPLQLRKLDEPTTGLGLKNIVTRYLLLVNKRVIIEKTDGNFVVKIPLLT